MIKSVSRHNLFMDFSKIQVKIGKPSDIDMFYLDKNYLLLGEIKNELGTFTENQKRLYENFASYFNKDTYIVFLVHDKYVEKGDKVVDVSRTLVRAIYCKDKNNRYRWYEVGVPTTCQEMLDRINERYANRG